MHDLDVAKFHQALKVTEEGIARLLASREGIVIQTSPDSSDEAQYQLERELHARSLDLESHRLTAVRLALQRIADATYGICEICDREIGVKRLAAVPWALYCIRCQERIDREQHTVTEPRSARLTAA